MLKEVYLVISGLVQGVFFRARTQAKARELGLVGWVRNTEDGKVEVVAQGNEDILKRFINWCYNESPGEVKEINEEWREIICKLNDFSIKY